MTIQYLGASIAEHITGTSLDPRSMPCSCHHSAMRPLTRDIRIHLLTTMPQADCLQICTLLHSTQYGIDHENNHVLNAGDLRHTSRSKHKILLALRRIAACHKHIRDAATATVIQQLANRGRVGGRGAALWRLLYM